VYDRVLFALPLLLSVISGSDVNDRCVGYLSFIIFVRELLRHAVKEECGKFTLRFSVQYGRKVDIISMC